MTIEEKIIKSAEYERRAIELTKELETTLTGGESELVSWYDTFWDNYQQNGKRYHYNNAFGNQGWTDDNYNPKYPLDYVRYANSMFLNSYIIDTKKPINFTGLLAQAGGVFQGTPYLKTIRTLTVTENTTFTVWFQNCTALENIEFAGTIGQNLDIHWSTLLVAESYHSIITHCSKTATFTLTLPAYDTVKAVYDAKYGDNAWDTIIAEHSNVTVVYS